MVSERARKAHEIFVRVLDAEPHDQATIVREACNGDAALRAEVDRLLAALTRSTGFLEESALRSTGRAPPMPPVNPPDSIGGYRIVRVLGAGGMATVYEAEQRAPRRRVALKVVHAGLAHTSAGPRLLFEADVLARLKHPGIAQIFEVGTANGMGVPFFAMEFVDGARPITEHARAKELSLPDRLAMFAEVCDAVQHGHHLGIIHRDLKPGNILVGSEGRAKVIDFGIARSVVPDAERITLAGERGSIIGTLSAMSPEQCSGEGQVDTRTDVYSLGVVLYELVTGRLPIEVSNKPFLDAVRAVQRDTPKRPSTFVPKLAPELDAVILKSLEKDARHRYATASELAADVRRFLENRPVLARPATTIEQVRKFARRNRSLVAVTTGIILVLALAAGVAGRMAYVASVARDEAELREHELEDVVAFQQSQLGGIDVPVMGDQLRAAILAGAKDPERAAAALDGVNFTNVALTALDASILERSRKAIDTQFEQRPLVRARLLQTLSYTMNTLGLKPKALSVLGDALEIRRTQLGEDHELTFQTMHGMAELLAALGKTDEAMTYARKAYDGRCRLLGPESPEALSSASLLGGIHRRRGEFDDARRIWTETLAIRRRVLGDDNSETLISLNNLGVICAIQDDLAEAEAAWRELLERRRRLLGPDSAEYRASLSNLGLLMLEQGKPHEGRPLLEEALTSLRRSKGDTHTSTLETMASVASARAETGDLEGAQVLLAECLELRRRTQGPESAAALRSSLEMAALLNQMGRRDEALFAAQATLATQRRTLGDTDADTIEAMGAVALIAFDAGRYDLAAELSSEALERSRVRFPGGHRNSALYQLRLGRALAALDRRDEAEAALLAADAALAAHPRANDPAPRQCADALVGLYDSWHKAAPGQGHDARAQRWTDVRASR